MVEKIEHLGIAVRSLAESRRFYEEVLGLVCRGEEEVAAQKVRVAFFEVGETQIELLEPTSPESPIARFLETRGEGIHHVAYRVADLKARLATARAAGYRLINEEPVVGAGGKRVAFLHPKGTSGVLTEFCEVVCAPE